MDPSKMKIVHNQPYDESVDVSDEEEVPSTNQTPRETAAATDQPTVDPSPNRYNQQYNQPPPPPRPSDHKRREGGMIYEEEEYEEESNEEGESEEEQEAEGPMQAQTTVVHVSGYDPSEYHHLQVSPDIKELFQYITRYTPQTISLDCRLIPFIPEYIPAIGDIDAFIKVTCPDGKGDYLGLTVLDEPSTKQSDPHVLDLQLRTHAKQSLEKPPPVHCIENPETDSKALNSWIANIKELHRQKPATNVHYTRNMPDIEELMQEWPPEFEDILKEAGLPNADLDCELKDFVDIICGLLDIPIRGNRIHSLHVLFSLFMEFKNSQHFNNYVPSTNTNEILN